MRKFLGIIENANTSSTSDATLAFDTLKLRHCMAIADLISITARLRPGQSRGPDPNGMNPA
jgi:hypothetical protein